MTKIIDADSFLKSMENLYTLAGWDEREVHFSLADLRCNLDYEEVVLSEWELKTWKLMLGEALKKMEQTVLYGVEKEE